MMFYLCRHNLSKDKQDLVFQIIERKPDAASQSFDPQLVQTEMNLKINEIMWSGPSVKMDIQFQNLTWNGQTGVYRSSSDHPHFGQDHASGQQDRGER